MIHYTSWIDLFVFALTLLLSYNGIEDVQLKTSWRNLECIGMHGNVKAMHVEFVTLDSNRMLLTYIFIPWNDMTLTNQQSDISSFFGLPDLLCVSPFAIVNELTTPDKTEHEVVLKEKITTYVAELVNVEKNAKRITYHESFTLGGQYQVMSMRQYPHLADLSIAVPGSAHLDPGILKNEFSNTMIYVSMIPDIGNVISSWIRSGDANELISVVQFQDELITFFNECLENAKEILDLSQRREYFSQNKKELHSLLEAKKIEISIQQMYIDLLRRLLCLPEEQMKKIRTDPVFGNYQPKTTPDVVTDYMPEIRDELEKLPGASLENLNDLIALFHDFKLKASANPGKMVEGNVLLGGLPEEYQPSKEELLLAEIGETISKIKDTNSEQIIREYLSHHEIEEMDFEFIKFTFIHYDVMGSGRFFYVNSKEKEEFRIP